MATTLTAYLPVSATAHAMSVFCPRLFQSLLQEFNLQCLSPELALQLPHPVLELANGAVRGYAIVAAHGNRPSFKHEATPTIQKVWRKAIAAGDRPDALLAGQRFLDKAELLCARPIPPTATISDEFDLRRRNMLRDIPKPPWL